MESPWPEAKREERHGYAKAAIGTQLHHYAGEQHGSGGGRGDVAGWRPRVERPHAGENCEADKDQGKSQHLEVKRKGELCQFAERGGFCAGHNIGGDESDEHHRASDEGVERKFHRSILAPRRTPDGDQEILRDNDNFVENKKKE